MVKEEKQSNQEVNVYHCKVELLEIISLEYISIIQLELRVLKNPKVNRKIDNILKK